MPSRIRLILLMVFWIGAFVATHKPVVESEEVSENVIVRNVDKIAHFGLYFLLALLLSFWLGEKRRVSSTVLATIAICVLYALIDESTQAFVPSRTPAIPDFLADCIGCLAGITVYATMLSVPGKKVAAE